MLQLRAELARLVEGFPNTLLNEVQLPASAQSGASAPNLNLNVMQKLLLLALDPYFARVLGMYFVDEQVAPGVAYDYCITGYWGATPCDNLVIYPGLAPAAPLARGSATFGGVTIAPLGNETSLWRWTKFDGSGNYDPRVDSTAPAYVQSAANAIAAGLTQAQQPQALLLAAAPPSFGIPFTAMPQLSIALTQTAARLDVELAGSGTVEGIVERSRGRLGWLQFDAAAADDPERSRRRPADRRDPDHRRAVRLDQRLCHRHRRRHPAPAVTGYDRNPVGDHAAAGCDRARGRAGSAGHDLPASPGLHRQGGADPGALQPVRRGVAGTRRGGHGARQSGDGAAAAAAADRADRLHRAA